jgi:type IV secretory pathway VirD2 relaxase
MHGKRQSAHVADLKRDGVTRDGGKAHMFGATEDNADALAFARRGLNDRHHFRFMVSPEDAAQITDLKALKRSVMRRDTDRR